MLFSILIPTYNNCKTIENAVKSALYQQYSNEYEVIVVNNASTDNTANLLSAIKDEKLHVYTNLSMVNIYANHNIALNYAKGDYVVFCHADDVLLPYALQVFETHIKSYDYPQRYVAFGHSSFRDFTEGIHSLDSLLTYNMLFSGSTAKKIFMAGGTTPSGTCYSRKSFIEQGGFDETNGAYESDWFSFLLAAFNGFEFEIIDRMLFKREYASTYVLSNMSEILKQRTLSMRRLMNNLTVTQQEDMRRIYWNNNLKVWDSIFLPPAPTKQERLKVIWLRYKQKPWCIWKLVKWILIKYDVWK